ncbi:MAG: type II secretion system F family protein [Candidatus Aureabacteria bacterium]|nr:type II secretion system F family protein [Candidatus Auribacterota bacterium]
MDMEIFLILLFVFSSVVLFVIGLTPSKKLDLKSMYEDAADSEIRTGILYTLTPFTKQLELFNAKLRGPKINTYKKFVGKRLTMSGNPFHISSNEFIGFQEILFFCCFVFSCLFFIKMPEGTILQKMLFVIVVISADMLIALIVPLFLLNDAITQRHKKLSRELPYVLDLLTISVEAGLDFVMAIVRVIEKGKAGPLRHELSVMLQQMKLGKRRREALQDMSERNNHPDLKTICASMIQADQMGSSLGPILRIQSDLLRRKRMLRAEKVAQQAPVKMLMPLIGCIFPAVFLVLLVPIILKLLSSV